MKLSRHLAPEVPREAASFLACVATVLELNPKDLPRLGGGEDPATGWTVVRWLGGLGLGLAQVSEPQTFTWPGPWIARVQPPSGEARFVVMYGVPSGVVWDPARPSGDGDGNRGNDSDSDGEVEPEWLTNGFLIAATDIALARPPLPQAPPGTGSVERIWIAANAGQAAVAVDSVRALAGQGLEGDRHVAGTGTFPSGLPGSALTLVEAEVCESFAPSLEPDEHRRNVITRGIALNRLVGHEFTVGGVRCRGVRLCEPCAVVQRYAGRPVLRELVHRGGLRADILEHGVIHVGDVVRAVHAAPGD
ncbi:MAG: MOSC domain-containing protein [Solirubrobacteraceae bacterium]